MKVLSSLQLPNKTILTLDGNVLDINAEKVAIDGILYPYDCAYDMDNTIGINAEIEECTEVEFR